MNINGYETMTTFWNDFTIADAFGAMPLKAHSIVPLGNGKAITSI